MLGFSALSEAPLSALPGAAAAAIFPVVQSVTRANNNTNATNRNVTLPATVNANDILIALFANDGDATVTWDNTTAGTWTELFSTASGAAVRLTAFWKVADGTEDGKVLDIATSAIERSAWHIYRISGAQSVEAGTAATGTNTAPNSPSLTPSWGSADTIWLPVFASDNQTSDPVTYPTNYTTNGIYDEAPNAAGVGIGSSYRDSAASSEDPGAFTISASLAWVANTIAVRPAAATGTGTLTATLGALTLTSASTLAITGAASNTLGALTLSSASTLAITGTASNTLAALTLSSAGSLAATASGTLSVTLGTLTLSSASTLAIKGTSAATLDALTLSSAGSLEAVAGTGSLAVALNALTLSSAGQLSRIGSAAITFDTLTLSSTTKLAIKGELTVTLASVVLSRAQGGIPGFTFDVEWRKLLRLRRMTKWRKKFFRG